MAHEMDEFTYRDWPDSFEQSARSRAERERRKKQLPLFPAPAVEVSEEAKEAA
jgi:hypothetical protein